MNYNQVAEFYIKKMCEFAGVDYNDIDLSKDLWDQNITWTKDQVQAYRDWMKDDLKVHKSRRNRAMNNSSKTNIPQFVNGWIAAYGFEIK